MDATVLCKNPDRLDGEVARKFMASELNLKEIQLKEIRLLVW
jgi:hypothetical protein